MYNAIRLNEEILKKNKKLKLKKKRIIVTITAGAMALITLVGVNVQKKQETKNIEINKTTIENFYGINSVEKALYDYICISEKLADLNLEKYEYNEDLFRQNISLELKSIEEIENLINEYKKEITFDKNIHSVDDHAKVVFELINQSKLVNEYIYEIGYAKSHANIRTATKEYAGEVFGVDASDIRFRIYSPSNEGPHYNMDVTGMYDHMDSIGISENDKDTKLIAKGIDLMDDTDTSFDNNNIDNNIYNKQRNKYISDALLTTIELEEKRLAEDLYNEDLATELKSNVR